MLLKLNCKTAANFNLLRIDAGCRCFIFLQFTLLTGCTTWAEEFSHQAAALHLKREIVAGTRFQHIIYRNTHFSSPTKTLHVYLDGDGTTWVEGRPADDPTPRNPMVIRLMAQDHAPAVYVGRPCYHGASAEGGCSSRYWREERYSEAVVASLCAAVKQLLRQGSYEKIAWFGHSGGGTLAVLLASRFPQTIAVITAAANLDIDAWSAFTGYKILGGSLNPALLPQLDSAIQQFHYAGSKDEIVPPKMMANAAAHLGAQLIIFEGYDHQCCWEQLWPSILNHLSE